MLYDITQPLYQGMPIYPGDPEVNIKKVQEIDSDGVEVHSVSLGTHSGTHIDAPRHLFKEGKTVDQIDPAVLIGSSDLFGIEGISKIGLDHISGLKPGRRLILKTGFKISSGEMKDYPYLLPDAGRYLVSCRISLLGIDSPSVDPPGSDQCHRILLEAGIVIVENLMLEGVPPGKYELMCLPLLLVGVDGSPARALLRKRGG
ncbi:MAG TPA: cyclase [Desulfotomaculum sp.]|nr:cyclase [Desulfotomaculum sp.]